MENTLTTLTTKNPPAPPLGDGFGVFHRRDSRSPWALIGSAPTKPEADRAKLDLMDSRSGDWLVSPLSDPPQKTRRR